MNSAWDNDGYAAVVYMSHYDHQTLARALLCLLLLGFGLSESDVRQLDMYVNGIRVDICNDDAHLKYNITFTSFVKYYTNGIQRADRPQGSAMRPCPSRLHVCTRVYTSCRLAVRPRGAEIPFMFED